MVVSTANNMAIRLKRVAIFLLFLLNVFMIFMNYRITDKHKYSIDLLPNKINKLIGNHGYQTDDKNIEHPLEQNNLMWGKIDNLHKALPAFEKMRRVLSNLKDYVGQFNREASYLGLSHEMLRFKSLMNLGDVDRLKGIFADVLQTNRSIKVGIVGGTYSSTKLFCKEKSCLYIDLISKWIEKILEVKVLVHNSAFSYATSDYFSWCLSPHLDANDMDIIIWELATEDYTMRDKFTRSIYDTPARPQEELTRRILQLPNSPYLLFFNFLSAKNIHTKDCVNSEYFAGRHLSKYYNVTSISWSTAVCSRLWRVGFTPDDLVRSDSQLSPRAHHQGSIFIINFFRNILEEVTLNQMNKTRTDENHINKLISLHDVFQENTNSQSIKSSIGNSQTITKAKINSTEGDIKSKHGPSRNLQSVKMKPTTNIQGKNQTQMNPKINSTNNNQIDNKLPPARYHGDALRDPTCWPASKPQFQHGRQPLKFSTNQGWEEVFSDRENWFTSTGPNQQLKFPIVIPFRNTSNLTSIAITMITCKYCGQALVWLDDHFDGAKLVNSKGVEHMFVVQRVLHGVPPGHHVVCIKNMEEKPFKLAAIMTSYDDNNNIEDDI